MLSPRKLKVGHAPKARCPFGDGERELYDMVKDIEEICRDAPTVGSTLIPEQLALGNTAKTEK